jgi:hypothetical protein
VNQYVREYCGDGRNVEFIVKIRRNQAVPELDLNNFAQYESGESVFNEDHSLRTFFEMAISQHAINALVLFWFFPVFWGGGAREKKMMRIMKKKKARIMKKKKTRMRKKKKD